MPFGFPSELAFGFAGILSGVLATPFWRPQQTPQRSETRENKIVITEPVLYRDQPDNLYIRHFAVSEEEPAR